jgi:hypothetical protein
VARDLRPTSAQVKNGAPLPFGAKGRGR